MPKRAIRTSNDLPRNHWIARQLPAGTSLRSYAEDEAITVLTSAVHDALNAAGLSRAEIADLLGTTRSYVTQVLSGSTNMTLRTLGALLWASGQQVAQLRVEPLGTMANARPWTGANAVPQGFLQLHEGGVQVRTSATPQHPAYRTGNIPTAQKFTATSSAS